MQKSDVFDIDSQNNKSTDNYICPCGVQVLEPYRIALTPELVMLVYLPRPIVK